MTSRNRWLRLQPLSALGLFLFGAIALTTRFLPAQTAEGAQKALEPSFEQIVRPFFSQNCVKCHNADLSTAGIRVDQLDARLEDRQIPVWEAIRARVGNGSMPPKGLPQPTSAERKRVEKWIGNAL